jgi:hypothetical protein
MGELSFLTIIVSLAVSALLVYAVFQYMKVRLTVLEQSHKEQAMILQQFIEESSTDIHRLYQISSSSTNGGSVATNGSIILEYANDNKPAAYNEPHMIHLDTALFQNKRNSNLIEISSDSEDTTDESEEHENSSSDDDDHSESSDDDNEADGSDSDDSQAEEDGAHGADAACDSFVVNDDECNHVPVISENVSSPEIKLITVDLGITQESERKFPITVEEMPVETEVPPPAAEAPAQAPPSAEAQPSSVTSSSIPLTNMSVPDLKHLLKEKYKNHPEKHAEIQKLKKAELIYALQHSQ